MERNCTNPVGLRLHFVNDKSSFLLHVLLICLKCLCPNVRIWIMSPCVHMYHVSMCACACFVSLCLCLYVMCIGSPWRLNTHTRSNHKQTDMVIQETYKHGHDTHTETWNIYIHGDKHIHTRRHKTHSHMETWNRHTDMTHTHSHETQTHRGMKQRHTETWNTDTHMKHRHSHSESWYTHIQTWYSDT